MDNLIDYTLHFLYLGFYKKNTSDEQIIIVDDNNNVFATYNKSKSKKDIFYIFYIFCVITLISWQILYSLINTISLLDISFQVLFVIEYIIGLFYLRSCHFNKEIRKRPELPYFFLVAIGMTICIVCLEFGFFISNSYKISVYYEILNSVDSKFFIVTLFLIEKSVSYLSFLIIVSIFVLNLRHDTKKIANYLEEFKNFLNIQQINMASVTKECTIIKEHHNETISKINYIFSATTVLGIIGIYCLIHEIKSNYIYINTIINCILFVIIEFIYVKSIRNVKQCISQLQAELFTEKIVLKFVTSENTEQHEFIEVSNELSLKKLNNILLYNLVLTGSTRQNVQWLALKEIIEIGWDKFEIFGFEIDDETIVQKFIGLVSTFMFAINLSNIFPSPNNNCPN